MEWFAPGQTFTLTVGVSDDGAFYFVPYSFTDSHATLNVTVVRVHAVAADNYVQMTVNGTNPERYLDWPVRDVLACAGS